MTNKYENYQTITNLRTSSAINRMALEKLNAEQCEFQVGDMVFFIMPENIMIVGKVVKTKETACVVECEGKKWLVNANRLSLF